MQSREIMRASTASGLWSSDQSDTERVWFCSWLSKSFNIAPEQIGGVTHSITGAELQ
jgi:hypothetical protein